MADSKADSDAQFDEEGKKILSDEQQDIYSALFGKYTNLSPVWRNEATGGIVFVGNQSAAQDKNLLLEKGIRNVVNCTSNMTNFHEEDDQFTYFRFDTCKAMHQYAVNRDELRPNHEQVLVNYTPVFEFIEGVINNGGNVLVHCLAGAHRAGSTGIACLMYFGGYGAAEATREAKKARPIISPIGFFAQYLDDLEVALKKKQKQQK
eukprot:CAMPEP_0201508578 /NCGR_PEP_ID=MMETSP0161_2-20130828/1908_1 /ASSEMBLY_ACC=CAM_ASM_000251 /TAXON_ID=180227 /ORGANISM="Neoparamoeba aestuarina, Strain SoJaBio B1-5/56/2" /LENGTH=205 /DNA_ID=CAMNT_0047903297 /DNA_START=51 /DNA_END=668 /DNA_ORIENTATION=+